MQTTNPETAAYFAALFHLHFLEDHNVPEGVQAGSPIGQ
jgi:hypothetical protein